MAQATIRISIADDAGNVQAMTGTVTIVAAPIIDSIAFSPATLPATGGVTHVTVTVHSPDGRPLTLASVTPSQGSIGPVSNPAVGRWEFDWTL